MKPNAWKQNGIEQTLKYTRWRGRHGWYIHHTQIRGPHDPTICLCLGQWRLVGAYIYIWQLNDYSGILHHYPQIQPNQVHWISCKVHENGWSKKKPLKVIRKVALLVSIWTKWLTQEKSKSLCSSLNMCCNTLRALIHILNVFSQLASSML